MTESEIFKKIQDIVNANPVIVLGSGASIGYGIASMSDLSILLTDYFSKKTYIEPACFNAVNEFLENINKKHMGLEEALLNIRMPQSIEDEIKEQVWLKIYEGDADVYESIIEGTKLALADLIDHMIYDRMKQVVNIVTTNYDRIAEYAVSQTEAYLNTLYKNKPIGEFDIVLQNNNVPSSYIGKVNVLKVHGSLDWFEKNGKHYSFMNSQKIPTKYQPCIITPGTNKYEKASQPPYRDLMQKVDEVFRQTNGFLCIGYGFNDIHVHPNLLSYSAKRKKAILIVTKDITPAIKERVIDAKMYPYIIIADNAGKGTVIYDSTDTTPLYIDGKSYWNISGLCEIIK